MLKYKLLGIVKYNNDTTRDLAKYLGIGYSSFGNKMNERTEFTRAEILKIKKKYNLNAEQVNDIFFTD